MARSEHRARLRRPLIALTLAALFLISGCGGIPTGGTPMTVNQYAAGDGARGDLGNQLSLENLMVLTEDQGAPGQLVGGVVNHWEQPAEVSFTAEELGETLSATAPGGETLLLNPEQESVVLSAVPVPPGAILEMQVSTPEEGSVTIPVPVLDGTMPPYDEYLPQEMPDPATGN
ncbi:MAG TPA: hypothetical protein VK063_08655 [Beutenbergiaceae bacterium]|nr:hypothetical protein [Beutenbergiaceae bacterium]